MPWKTTWATVIQKWCFRPWRMSSNILIAAYAHQLLQLVQDDCFWYCDIDAILCASYSYTYLVSWDSWCWKGPVKQNHLGLLVHNHVQAALECLQGWRCYSLLGQAVPLLGKYRSVSRCSCSTFCVSPCAHWLLFCVSGHQLQIVCLHLLCSLPSGIYSLNKIPPEPSLPQAVQSQLLHLVTSIQQGYALWMPLVNLKCYLQGKWCLNYRVKYYDMQQAYHILKSIICGFFRNYFKQF